MLNKSLFNKDKSSTLSYLYFFFVAPFVLLGIRVAGQRVEFFSCGNVFVVAPALPFIPISMAEVLGIFLLSGIMNINRLHHGNGNVRVFGYNCEFIGFVFMKICRLLDFVAGNCGGPTEG